MRVNVSNTNSSYGKIVVNGHRHGRRADGGSGCSRISLFHILTLGSIGASIALFFSGNKQAGIFVGLWPPTFQALKSVVDKNKNK
jgi:hypothetical protein